MAHRAWLKLPNEIARATPVDLDELRAEVAPVFRKRDGKQTDVVVLGCTHYPLLTEDIEKVAPWPVTYIDPAPAIARRTADLVEETPLKGPDDNVPAPRHGDPHFGTGQCL